MELMDKNETVTIIALAVIAMTALVMGYDQIALALGSALGGYLTKSASG